MRCLFSPYARLRTSTFSAIFLALAALLAAFALPAHAQTFDATTLRQPINLGMNWLVTSGDNPAYAQANYDDSHWIVVDPNKSLKTYFPNERPNVIWYRLHVNVNPNQTGLGLEEWNLSTAFDIYVNGRKLMQSGSVSPYVPYTLGARVLAAIPDDAVKSGSFVIALRIGVSQTDWINAFPGLFPYNLVFGQKAALDGSAWLSTIGLNVLGWFSTLAMVGLGFIALALFTAQRQQREYLWIALMALAMILIQPIQLYELFHNLPAWTTYLTGSFNVIYVILETLMYLAFLRLPVARWMQVLLALSVIGILYNSMEVANGIGTPVTLVLSLTPQLILFAFVIPVLLIIHWQRGNREAGILLIPALLSSLTIFIGLGGFIATLIPANATAAEHFLEVMLNLTVGPFRINLGNLGNCFFALSLAVIIVLRSTRIAAREAQIEAEMEAAREVQRIVVPEDIESVPGLAVETAYEPAQQVGGDFFQVIPASDDSLLVVIGDVAGKGLPAAMLVSVLVGAIRAQAEYTEDPAALLEGLNHRMVGRIGAGFCTAMAARIYPDGAVLLANAGHLPPYLDCKEVDVPGALPLGAKGGTRYETIRFLLPRGSKLTFYSDGIVEATNPAGELFGFERSRTISEQPVAKILETAKQFGQNDDMTAISITRAAASEARQRSNTVAEFGVVTS